MFYLLSSNDLVKKIESAWADYVNAAGVIHGRCRSREFTRKDFREMYEYLIGGGLHFQAVQFDPNITHLEREEAEEEARAFYAENYPHVNYRGIIGFNAANATSLEPRWDSDYYFPIHYMEPVVGNEIAIDLDYHASGSRRATVLYCMEHGLPALTDRLRLVQEKEAISFGVVLMHPGYSLSTTDDAWPRDLASIVIRIPDLIQRSANNQAEGSHVYIYDESDSSGKTIFLGGATIVPSGGNADLEFLPEVDLHSLRGGRLYKETRIEVANKIWTISVSPSDGTFEPVLVFVITGGIIIFLATVALAGWVYVNMQRVAKFNRMQAEAEAEKAALILQSAKKAAEAERELNDFIAHEVRNPVAAAMSACSFVKRALKKKDFDELELQNTRDDVRIIDNSLNFVNDLLRNMLDMHRAANKKLKVTLAPTVRFLRLPAYRNVPVFTEYSHDELRSLQYRVSCTMSSNQYSPCYYNETAKFKWL
jgi:CHASE1-domain containing sensor protein